MKNFIYVFFLFLFITGNLYAQSFDNYFYDKTMRVDYFHTGTKGTEIISLDRVYEEGMWAGSLVNLIDALNLGEYMVRVFDVTTATMIYSRGYSSMFQEWQTTDEALAGIYRTFHESVRMPLPKNKIQFTIHRRDKNMQFREIFSTIIDPNNPTEINREKKNIQFSVIPLMKN